MRHGMRILTLALAGLLAFASPALANPNECPECDEDVPANDDCSFSSVDGGVITEDAGSLYDTDACVSKEDDPRGFWAVLSLCLSSWFSSVTEFIGFDMWLDVFTSEDGTDVDAGLSTPVGDVDLEETPLGDLDDATWQAADTLEESGVETPDLPPLGLDDAPTVDEDLCLYPEDIELPSAC